MTALVTRGRCVCGCRKRGQHRHHAIYQQELRRAGGDPRDDRNLVWVTFACHGAHHNRSRPLELRHLPDSVFAFAAETLGAGPAYEYLRRRYTGPDARLEQLLASA